jgi:hypothetical protein
MLRIVLILVMVGIMVAGAYFLFLRFRTTGGLVQSARDAFPTIVEDEPEAPFLEPFTEETLVTVNDNGMNPVELTTKPFVEVIWKNNTQEAISIEHAPDDGSDQYSTFRSGTIEPGKSYSFDFYYRRTYRYHDRYHPERIGFVYVK